MSKETHIEHLIKLVRKEKVSLFIGAGFSLEAKAPSVWDLQQAILNELPSDDMKKVHAEDGLDAISQFFVEEVCEGSRAVVKTEDIHPPKTGISVHFCVLSLMAMQK